MYLFLDSKCIDQCMSFYLQCGSIRAWGLEYGYNGPILNVFIMDPSHECPQLLFTMVASKVFFYPLHQFFHYPSENLCVFGYGFFCFHFAVNYPSKKIKVKDIISLFSSEVFSIVILHMASL